MSKEIYEEEEEAIYEEEEDNGDDEIDENDVPEGILRAAFTGNMKDLQHYVHKHPEQMNDYYERIGYPLHCAVFNDKAEAVEYLLKKGAKINQKGALGQTPLHYACQGEEKKVFDLLINTKGIEIEIPDDEGDTPMLLCARHNKAEYADQLLKKGARVDYQNKSMDTALHCAAQYGALDTAKVLIAAGANVNLINSQFKTAFMNACESHSADVAAVIQAEFARQQSAIVIEDYSSEDEK